MEQQPGGAGTVVAGQELRGKEDGARVVAAAHKVAHGVRATPTTVQTRPLLSASALLALKLS